MAAKQGPTMESLMECPICLGSFQDPRILACLHTFCKKCLEDHVSASALSCSFKCPTCRHEFRVPKGGIASVPKNFFLNSLKDVLEQQQQQQQSDKPAGSSEQPSQVERMEKGKRECYNSRRSKIQHSEATVYCGDCAKFYCESCESGHMIFEEFSEHHFIPAREVNPSTIQTAETTRRGPRCDVKPRDMQTVECSPQGTILLLQQVLCIVLYCILGRPDLSEPRRAKDRLDAITHQTAAAPRVSTHHGRDQANFKRPLAGVPMIDRFGTIFGDLKTFKYHCKNCNRGFGNNHALEQHDEDKHFWCKVCDRYFYNEHVLQQHDRDKHTESDDDDDDGDYCVKCDRQFSSQRALEQHDRNKHFWCKECDRYFPHSRALGQHDRDKHDDNDDDDWHDVMFICEKCFFPFDSKRALEQHKRDKHFWCKKCERYFRNERVLEKHTRDKHDDDDDVMFVCEKCFFPFDSKRALEQHKRDKHFWCKECNRYFRNERALEKHTRDKHDECRMS